MCHRFCFCSTFYHLYCLFIKPLSLNSLQSWCQSGAAVISSRRHCKKVSCIFNWTLSTVCSDISVGRVYLGSTLKCSNYIRCQCLHRNTQHYYTEGTRIIQGISASAVEFILFSGSFHGGRNNLYCDSWPKYWKHFSPNAENLTLRPVLFTKITI